MKCENFVPKAPGPVWAGALCVCGAQKKAHVSKNEPKRDSVLSMPSGSVDRAGISTSLAAAPERSAAGKSDGTACKVDNCSCVSFEVNQFSAKKCAHCLHSIEDHSNANANVNTNTGSTTFARLALRQAGAPPPSAPAATSGSGSSVSTSGRFRAPSLTTTTSTSLLSTTTVTTRSAPSAPTVTTATATTTRSTPPVPTPATTTTVTTTRATPLVSAATTTARTSTSSVSTTNAATRATSPPRAVPSYANPTKSSAANSPRARSATPFRQVTVTSPPPSSASVTTGGTTSARTSVSATTATTTNPADTAPVHSGFRAPSITATSPSAFGITIPSPTITTTTTTTTSSMTTTTSTSTTLAGSASIDTLPVPARPVLRPSIINATLSGSTSNANSPSPPGSLSPTAAALSSIGPPARVAPSRTSIISNTSASPPGSPQTPPVLFTKPSAFAFMADRIPHATNVVRKSSGASDSPIALISDANITGAKHNDAEFVDIQNELQTEKRANSALTTQLELQKQETAIVEKTLALQEQQRSVLASQVEHMERRNKDTDALLLAQRRKTDELTVQINHLQKDRNELEEALKMERTLAAKVDSVKLRENHLVSQMQAVHDKQAESVRRIEELELKLREAEYALSTQQQVNEDLLAQNKDLQLSAAHAAQVKQQDIVHQQQRSALVVQVSELERKLRETEHALNLQHRTNEELQHQRVTEVRALQHDLQRQESIINEGRKYDQKRELEMEDLKRRYQEGQELQAAQQELNEELIAQTNAFSQDQAVQSGQEAALTATIQALTEKLSLTEHKHRDAEKALIVAGQKQRDADKLNTSLSLQLKELRTQQQSNGNKNSQDDAKQHEHLSHEILDLRESLASRDRDLEEMAVIFDQMSREKDGIITTLEKDIAQLRGNQKAENELEVPSPRATGLRPSRTSLLLTDAANYFQANLEISKKDFRIEQLEGLLAKAEMDAHSRKHKCDQLNAKIMHLEQEQTKLLKAKEAMSKELAIVTREMTSLRTRLASSTTTGPELATATINELERENLFEEFETGENAHAQQLMDLTVLVTNLKDTLPKLKQEISALCAILQSMITLQVACAKGLKEARLKGEKQAMGFFASHVSAMDRLLQQYLAALSALRTAGFQEEINKVDNSRIELPLTHPAKLATFLQTLKDSTSTQLPGYELIASTCNFCMTKASAIQKAQEHARQTAAVTVLQTKIHCIPDDFELTKNSRVLHDETLMWYVLQQVDERPLSHPIRSREVESVRIFLFNDTLLITTLEYKYRYRLELEDTQISPLTTLRLVLKADLFTDDDIKLNDEDDLVWPDVPTWEPIEAATLCLQCKNKARHNCRLCGRGVCTTCSTKTVVPPRFERKPNKKKSRVCLGCDETLKRNLETHGERGAGLLTTSDSAGAITVLQCNSTTERDAWVLKIRATVEKRKQEVGQKLVEKGKRQSIMLRNPDQGFSEGVRVFLRIRPFVLDIEKESGEICLGFQDNVARLEQKSLDEWRVDRVGYYDNIWGPECTQSDVFQDAGRPVVAAILNGVNCAVMCYGNTGSGKTYTMTGLGNSAKSGLLPRILEALLADKPDCSVSAKMAYVQVYNGRVEDLLRTRAEQPLELMKDKSGRYSTMYFCPILNVNQAMMSLIKSQSLRATRSHNMNDISSRSHALCILQVRVTPKNGLGKPREAMLQLVDLAGSENTISTGVDREGSKEAIEINKSLISLGRVVHALNENTKRTKGKTIVVPFRESPLTIILRDVLEKECLCHVVLNCSCSPALQQARQTAKTMAFGDSLRKLAANQKS